MNTVIVPVDFSETSMNAAHYAANLYVGHYGVTILLFHSYDIASELDEAQKKLDDLKNKLVQEHAVKLETLAHYGDNFIEGLERAVRHRGADLVIMGITGRNAMAQLVIGSNTLKMAETKACPVLIIPEKMKYKAVRNVMLSSDFKDTLNTTPSVPIKNFLDLVQPNLHIVNVDPNHYISLTEIYEKEKGELDKMFNEYNPEYYFMRLYDIDDALNLFAEEKNIDLIIAIHRHHSFFDRLFHKSRTSALSYKSNIPILVVHE